MGKAPGRPEFLKEPEAHAGRAIPSALGRYHGFGMEPIRARSGTANEGEDLMKHFDLTGKSIGLTGGSGWLGSAVARGLAEAGARVVICGRNLSKLEETAGLAADRSASGTIVPVEADVGNPKHVDRILEVLSEGGAALDGWVNNAYAPPGGRQLAPTRDEAMEGMCRAFVDPFLVTQKVAERMKSAGGGSIVNVASMYGMVSPRPNLYDEYPQYHNPPVYGAGKAALLQFTRYAACHWAPFGIRVNAVSPGPFPRPDLATGFEARLAREVPLGRVGRPADLIGPIHFLLSDGAGFTTGTNLVVDGGWTTW